MERLLSSDVFKIICDFVPKEVRSVSNAIENIQLMNIFSLVQHLLNKKISLLPTLSELEKLAVLQNKNPMKVAEKINYFFKIIFKSILNLAPRKIGDRLTFNEIFHLMGRADLNQILLNSKKELQDGALLIFSQVLRAKPYFLRVPLTPIDEVRRWFESEGNQERIQSIKQLNLNNKNLLCVPEEIRFFTKLTDLSLSDNDILELPKSICNLKLLTYLFLNGNQIRQVPNQIGQLIELIILDLKSNPIKELPNSVILLKKLRMIHLNSKRSQNFESKLKKLPFLKIYYFP